MKWYTECELQRVNKELEKIVEARIQEFIKVNKELQIKFIELQQTQLALQESEEKFRMIFTSSIDGIIVADPATKKFIYVNPAICKALDYTEEELTQMSVVDIHPKNSLERVVSEFEALARGEKFLAMNIPFLKKDGTIIYMDINASLMKIGGKHRVMGIFRDITERVKAEETLKKSHNELEHRVEDRTRKLKTTLKTMKRKEKEIIQHKSSLEKVNREIMETNQALSVLARNIDRDKEFLEKKIYETTSVNIMPIIKELQNDTNCKKHQAELEVLTAYLNGLISGPTDHHDIIISLTDQEMRVAVMIKNDLTSQKIANMLYISLHTVKTHRKSIRKKLNIQNSTVNLASYLKSKMVSNSM
jgi:PAS domain S-box-containing protein